MVDHRVAPDDVPRSMPQRSFWRGVVRDPVGWLLVAAGVAELASGGTLARGAVLFTGALMIVVDHARSRPRRRDLVPPGRPARGRPALPKDATQRRLERPAVGVVVVIAVALVAPFGRYALPAALVVVPLGVAAVAWAWLTIDPAASRTPTGPPDGWPLWLGLALTVASWEVVALLMQPTLQRGSFQHPTLSTLVEPALMTVPGRLLGLLLWVWCGRELARRA